MSANVQGTVHVLECARHARGREVRLCRVVVLLRARADADARGSPDRAAVSLRAEQVPGRAGGVPLASGLQAAGQLDPHLQRLRHALAHLRAPTARCSACSCGRSSRGKPFTVVGDGTQRRDFLYVTDVARAFLAAAETSHAGAILEPRRRQPAVGEPAGRAARRRDDPHPEAPGRARLHLGGHRADHAPSSAGGRR